jgi:hypothetical protein
MQKFDYVIENINNAVFRDDPFRHLYMEQFFSPEHFKKIIDSPEVNISPVENDEELISELHKRNFKEISFPGTTTDIAEYLKWHKDPAKAKNLNQDTCEGFGVTFRLQTARENSILSEIIKFLGSSQFWETASRKFGLNLKELTTDVGLQKYLDGYEISPHPDIRKKALTFMINVNPADDSEEIRYHTNYLTFKPEKDFIRQFWSQHQDIDRCWVPWDWCETRKTQTKNNSMVMFSPSDNTLHAVKASYDHLSTQRTQYYGNLWFKESRTSKSLAWRDFISARD